MPKDNNNHRAYQLPDAVKAQQTLHRQQAKTLLDAYFAGNAAALTEFERHPDIKNPDFRATLLDARMLVSSSGFIVQRLSLEKLKKLN